MYIKYSFPSHDLHEDTKASRGFQNSAIDPHYSFSYEKKCAFELSLGKHYIHHHRGVS